MQAFSILSATSQRCRVQQQLKGNSRFYSLLPKRVSKNDKIPHFFNHHKTIVDTFSSKSNKNHSSKSSNFNQFALFAIAAGGAYSLVYAYMYYEKSATSDNNASLIEAGDLPADPQAPVTSRTFFDIEIDGQFVGRIILGLHGSVAPRTVKNFESLCRGHDTGGTTSLKYENSPFHRIIPNFMIQGGDITQKNGYGGMSIYGKSFADENFTLKHIGNGVVSMANAGKDTNSSQFFICTTKTAHLDGKHTVFGVVLDGWDVVRKIESCGCRNGRPLKKVMIVRSGVLED